MTDEVDLPLAGVRVVEIGQLIAIPSAGQQLSDLGAEVIKLEPPGGEPARQIDADYARGIFYGYNRGSVQSASTSKTPPICSELGI